ncbi:ABC transporter ATP-binding protein [Leptospira fletcheri]|uniref:ABC transporter ATP-binding protein n=1 Tax=Leptospira fletcheri TaxID=2484981 RepID=A0A4V6QKS2_9LEPT|nr:ATP-binding cassette domain-containing protein [Leptospira fletcheri]TGK12315.1 ABC transporter ATP-binding protein [Leptospira fletcheri]
MAASQTPVPVLECSGLFYTIGRKSVLKNVSFSVFPGEALLVRGRNGAGKTTLLKSVLHHGKFSAEFRFRKGPKPKISYLGHELGLYTTLSLEENLEYFRGISGTFRDPIWIETWLKHFRLWTRRMDPVSSFSRGMKQKAALVRALAPISDLYLLDEPLTALDGEGAAAAVSLLESVCSESAMMLVTHDPNFALKVKTRVLDLGENSR